MIAKEERFDGCYGIFISRTEYRSGIYMPPASFMPHSVSRPRAGPGGVTRDPVRGMSLQIRSCQGGTAMLDAIMLILGGGVFVAAILYAIGCDRI
jgi:hypothetical protein